MTVSSRGWNLGLVGLGGKRLEEMRLHRQAAASLGHV